MGKTVRRFYPPTLTNIARSTSANSRYFTHSCTSMNFHTSQKFCNRFSISNIYRCQLKGSVKELNISTYFFFPPVTQWCSISDVLFTSGRGVSDLCFEMLLNMNYSTNILSECVRILIDCRQLPNSYYNVLFGSCTRDRNARRIYLRTFIKCVEHDDLGQKNRTT